MFAIDKYILLCYNNSGKGDMSMGNNKKNLPNWAKLKKTILLSLVASTALAAFSGIFIACDENENNQNNQNGQNEQNQEALLAEYHQRIEEIKGDMEEVNQVLEEYEEMMDKYREDGDILAFDEYYQKYAEYDSENMKPLEEEYHQLLLKILEIENLDIYNQLSQMERSLEEMQAEQTKIREQQNECLLNGDFERHAQLEQEFNVILKQYNTLYNQYVEMLDTIEDKYVDGYHYQLEVDESELG